MSELDPLPRVFRERLADILPAEAWEGAVRSFTQPTPTTFRVNTLKADAGGVLAELESAGLRLEAVPWSADAFILREGRLEALQETAAYKEGRLYVQSLSSMLPVLVLDPRPGETVLDLTAAPGSKTTQIAARMRGEGRLIANDNNRVRFYKLRANLQLQGADSVELSRRHGQAFGKTPGIFDRVLVDAPCSTEGRFYLQKPSSYRYWRPEKIHEMAEKQRGLLLSGARALKLGGRLVYSTCTFGPEENEAVVDWVLKKEPGMALAPIDLPVDTQPGFAAWRGKTYDPSLALSRRVLPNTLYEGFYIACFEKRA